MHDGREDVVKQQTSNHMSWVKQSGNYSAWHSLCFASCCAFFLLIWSTPSGAVDGGIDVRNFTQSNDVGDQIFSSSTLRETIFLRQRIPLHERWMLAADARWMRDTIGSSFGTLDQESERKTLLPPPRTSSTNSFARPAPRSSRPSNHAMSTACSRTPIRTLS